MASVMDMYLRLRKIWNLVDDIPADAEIESILVSDSKIFVNVNGEILLSDDNGSNWTYVSPSATVQYLAAGDNKLFEST